MSGVEVNELPEQALLELRSEIDDAYAVHGDDMVFSDLDDTISTNRTLFLSKLSFLLRFKRLSYARAYELALKEFSINPDFIAIMRKLKKKNIFILSRNDNDFVHYFIENTRQIFGQYGLEIIGGIGSKNLFQGGTKLSSLDKITLLPKDSIMISDIFEEKILKIHNGFISVDSNSYLTYIYKILYKMTFFLLFLIKNICKKY